MIKKRIFTILMSLAMVITMMPMMAGVAFAGSTAPQKGDDFTVGNLSYTVLDYDHHVVVRKADNLKASELTGTVVVPEKVTYAGVPYTVSEIQEFAFKNCVNMESFVLGTRKETVVIGRQAFKNCSGLNNFSVASGRFVLGNGNEPSDAFEGVGTKAHRCWLNAFDYGEGGTYFVNELMNSFGHKQVSVPEFDGMKIDGEQENPVPGEGYFIGRLVRSLYKASECSLKAENCVWSMCIPNAILSTDPDTYTVVFGGYDEDGKGIEGSEGKYYSQDYEKISEVIIPETTEIKNIGNGAFTSLGSECGIDEIVLPSTVREIGNAVFAESGVKSVVFNKGLEKLGNLLFNKCNNLKKVTFKSTPWYEDRGVKYVGVSDYAFYGMYVEEAPTLVLPLNWEGAKYNSTNWYGGQFKQYINPAKCPKLTAKKYGKRSFKLSWKKISGASYYVVQGAKKGKTLKNVVKTSKNSYKVKKLSGKTLKKGTKYRMRVLVYDKKGNLIGKSSVITKRR